jgi:molybdopterin-guanine dinucleotide biosynthesis protein B
LIERLLPLLGQRGLRVAVLKHAHKGFAVDTPGKDSFRVRAAGAVQVLVASQREWALLGTESDPGSEPRLAQLLGRFDRAQIDLVLCEGFAHEDYPKIEVYRPALGKPLRCWPEDPNVLAVATDGLLPDGPPVERLDLNDPEGVLAFLARNSQLPL